MCGSRVAKLLEKGQGGHAAALEVRHPRARMLLLGTFGDLSRALVLSGRGCLANVWGWEGRPLKP